VEAKEVFSEETTEGNGNPIFGLSQVELQDVLIRQPRRSVDLTCF